MHSGAPRDLSVSFSFCTVHCSLWSESFVHWQFEVLVCGTQNYGKIASAYRIRGIKWTLRLDTAQKLEPTSEHGEQTRTVPISMSIAYSIWQAMAILMLAALNESLHNTQAS